MCHLILLPEQNINNLDTEKQALHKTMGNYIKIRREPIDLKQTC